MCDVICGNFKRDIENHIFYFYLNITRMHVSSYDNRFWLFHHSWICYHLIYDHSMAGCFTIWCLICDHFMVGYLYRYYLTNWLLIFNPSIVWNLTMWCLIFDYSMVGYLMIDAWYLTIPWLDISLQTVPRFGIDHSAMACCLWTKIASRMKRERWTENSEKKSYFDNRILFTSYDKPNFCDEFTSCKKQRKTRRQPGRKP